MVAIINNVPMGTAGGDFVPSGFDLKFGSIAWADKGDKIPLAVYGSMTWSHSQSSSNKGSSGGAYLRLSDGTYKELGWSSTSMSGNDHTTNGRVTSAYLVPYFPLVDGKIDIAEMSKITSCDGNPNIVMWLEPR